MMTIEKFLETRANQSRAKAHMIEIAIKKEDWMGDKPYTQADIDSYILDAEKCEAALKFIKTEYPRGKKK